MKVAILAGGKGERMGASDRHKAMTMIGEHPILWHVMSIFARQGFTQFVIATGHHATSIERYFIAERVRGYPSFVAEVALVDTGLEVGTGGRIKRLAPYLGNDRFMLTWCDGLANLNLQALLAAHHAHGRIATVTAVHPPGRFGRLLIVPRNRVVRFAEKGVDHREWINGAFFVLEPAVLDYIADDGTSFERDVLPVLAADDQLYAYLHEGFWRCMDTPKEAQELDALWRAGNAPWIIP